MSIPEIAEATGVTYPTAHRIVSVLLNRRYLKQVGSRNYGLGPKVIELGFLGYQQADVRESAQPFLKDLSQATSDTVHLAQLDDGEAVYLDKVQSQRPIEISSRIGGRKPAITTGVGKALLFDEGEDEWRRLFKRDHHAMRIAINEEDFIKLMHQYREWGFSYDQGENERQIRCVAAPVRDGSRRVVAAVSVSSTHDGHVPGADGKLGPNCH